MPERKRRRKGGGRRGKAAAREKCSVNYRPYIERKIPYFEILINMHKPLTYLYNMELYFLR